MQSNFLSIQFTYYQFKEELMKHASIRIPWLGAAVLGFGLLAVSSTAPAAQNQPLPVQQKPVPVQQKPVICSDIVSRLSVQKSNDGTIMLTGKVCNEGPGGYSNPTGPLDAYFMVYTWHPPKTPAQEGDLKFYTHTDLGTALKANECKNISYAYPIQNFSRWGTFPSSATERQAMKQFCVQVQKKGPTGFTSCEDTNMTNTTECLDVPYMEKIK
jgi:hypothetical protein